MFRTTGTAELNHLHSHTHLPSYSHTLKSLTQLTLPHPYSFPPMFSLTPVVSVSHTCTLTPMCTYTLVHFHLNTCTLTSSRVQLCVYVSNCESACTFMCTHSHARACTLTLICTHTLTLKPPGVCSQDRSRARCTGNTPQAGRGQGWRRWDPSKQQSHPGCPPSRPHGLAQCHYKLAGTWEGSSLTGPHLPNTPERSQEKPPPSTRQPLVDVEP